MEFEDNYYQNPNLTTVGFDNNQDVERLKSRINEFFSKYTNVLQNSLGREMDYTMYTGSTGIAYLFFKLSFVLKDRSAELLESSLGIVEHSLKELNSKRVSFLCGDAGPLSLAVVLYHLDGKISDRDKVLEILLNLANAALKPSVPDEFLYGRCGYFYALKFVQRHTEEALIPKSLLKKVLTYIVSSGRELAKKMNASVPLMYEWHNKVYYGAAHGLAGIYYTLIKNKDLLDSVVTDDELNECVQYLYDRRFTSDNLPSSHNNQSDRLVSWCHGAAGATFMFISAAEALNSAVFKSAATACGNVVWLRGLLKKGVGICHGAAGNGYTHLALFRYTKKDVHLKRAYHFAEWCLDYQNHKGNPDRPFSLFEGLAGTVFFLAEVQNASDSKFPAFEF